MTRIKLASVLSEVSAMAQVLVRQLDDHVVNALRARAKAQGLSLEQSLREELARLRATTPAAGRSLDVAALITPDQRLLRKLELAQSGLPAALDLASFTG